MGRYEKSLRQKPLIAGSRMVLPPASSTIEATPTKQKNDYYNDENRGHVHGFLYPRSNRTRAIRSLFT
jgi:hypothetical protein